MVININTELRAQEEHAKRFLLLAQREFAIRSGQHKPSDALERRWLQEGIRPIAQFETIGDMFAESLCRPIA